MLNTTSIVSQPLYTFSACLYQLVLHAYLLPPKESVIINTEQQLSLNSIQFQTVIHSVFCLSSLPRSTMASFRISDCTLLGKAFQTFRCMRDIANINFSSAGVSIIGSHSLDPSIAVLKINPSGCEYFHCNESGTLGIDVKDLLRRCEAHSADECSVSVYIYADKGEIEFYFEGKQARLRFLSGLTQKKTAVTCLQFLFHFNQFTSALSFVSSYLVITYAFSYLLLLLARTIGWLCFCFRKSLFQEICCYIRTGFFKSRFLENTCNNQYNFF